jgi:hypothetical protein
MYTPITWAEPNKLKHLREKRTVERVDRIHTYKSLDRPKKFKNRMELLWRKPSLMAKTMRVSLSS